MVGKSTMYGNQLSIKYKNVKKDETHENRYSARSISIKK